MSKPDETSLRMLKNENDGIEEEAPEDVSSRNQDASESAMRKDPKQIEKLRLAEATASPTGSEGNDNSSKDAKTKLRLADGTPAIVAATQVTSQDTNEKDDLPSKN